MLSGIFWDEHPSCFLRTTSNDVRHTATLGHQKKCTELDGAKEPRTQKSIFKEPQMHFLLETFLRCNHGRCHQHSMETWRRWMEMVQATRIYPDKDEISTVGNTPKPLRILFRKLKKKIALGFGTANYPLVN